MRLGIDLGGTKIELIALDGSDEIYRKRVSTPKGDYLATVQTMVDLVNEAESILGEQGSLGIGIPGAISPHTGLVKNANSVCLIGQDLKGDLERALNRPVMIENDANCFALSEATDGAGEKAKSVFGVIVGTGCGGGLVYNGQLITGPNSIAGEWGHNPLPWLSEDEKGRACYCGQSNCIETYLSGPAFERTFAELSQATCSAKQIIERMEQGDLDAVEAFENYAHQMAKALASVINVFDPEVIVLGGGMSNVTQLYQRVPEIWQDYVFSDAVYTQLRPPKYGDSSGVRGAAWL